MEQTTIQISKELAGELQKRKFSPKESYENVIWDLVEDTLELSDETKASIAQGRKDFAEGKYKSLEQIKKEYSIK